MARIQAFPYRRPRPGRVQSVEWYLLINDGPEPLGDRLPHWDAATPVDVRVRLVLDTAGVRADCELAPADGLSLVLAWHCPSTSLRGRGDSAAIPDTPTSETVLDLHLAGGLLADRLRLETQLVLAGAGQGASRLAPVRPGSLLWRDERLVLLEGQAARFPMEVIDFDAHAWLPTGAAWYLDWDLDDLRQLVLGGMRLFINAQTERVARAVSATDPVATVITEAIQFDVARTLILAVLDNDEFVGHAETYGEESIGAAMRRLLNTLFPFDSLDGLQQQRRRTPGRFECMLQARLHLFQEG